MPKRSARAAKSRAVSRANAPTAYSNPQRERQWGNDGTIVCPDSVRVKLVWSVTLRPGTASGGLYYYQFRGNSVYDPDYTGTGTQPNGFDQWCSFYNSYLVLGSKIHLEVMGATQSCLTSVVPSFNTTLATSAVDSVGYRYAQSKLTGYSGAAALVKLSNQISTAEICGVTDAAVLSDTDYSATVSTNPGNNFSWYWALYHQNQYDTSTLNSVINVKITYDVKFFNPIQQGLSSIRRGLPYSPQTITLGVPQSPASAAAGTRANEANSRTEVQPTSDPNWVLVKVAKPPGE